MTFLSFNFSFDDLHAPVALEKLDGIFMSFLEEAAFDLRKRLKFARQFAPLPTEESALLLDLAPYVEDFIGTFFSIEPEIQSLQNHSFHLAPLYRCKRLFVQRQAAKAFPKEEAQQFNGPQLQQELSTSMGEAYSDLAFARYVLKALEDKETHKEFLQVATQYAAWALHQDKPSTLFRLPRKVNPDALFPVNREANTLTSPDRTHRKGFDCTTSSIQTQDALDQAHYCILCHNQDKDSCAKGLSESLKGCPLDQKISEMNTLRTQGHVLGALAMIMVDNPMVAATGHRICNDCEKACIFQKQEAVDIPSIESETLESVLNLPWGVEIYSLLSRWNPLNLKRPFPKEATGYNVLVAGMGPAGFTLAHYLLNEGHRVVGMDELDIEPLEGDLLTQPIRDWSAIKTPLSQRTIDAFGGVMEYGITVRWDKNALKLVRLLLERRSQFSLRDGVRIGETLTLPQAFESGFDHVALCLGAGNPTTLSIPYEGVQGVSLASDFLMDLQLKGDPNIQIQAPILIVGGGLTAVDASTEVLAYYEFHVKQFLKPTEEVEGPSPATIVYRKSLQASPAYRLNHKELQLAMAEGVRFLENATPLEICVDAHGHVESLKVQTPSGVEFLPCRTLLIATGTSPNQILEQEGLSPSSDSEGQGVLLSYKGEPKVSFFGDLNPIYEGNVVRAMASAKNGYPSICEELLERAPRGGGEFSPGKVKKT